jgi:hypothetical protein
MPQDFTPNLNASRTRVTGYSGAQANQNFAGNLELEKQQFQQQFDAAYPGASGIAGGATRATPQYKQKFEQAWNQYQAQKALQPLQQASGDMGALLGQAAPLSDNPQGDALAAQLMGAFSKAR